MDWDFCRLEVGAVILDEQITGAEEKAKFETEKALRETDSTAPGSVKVKFLEVRGRVS